MDRELYPIMSNQRRSIMRISRTIGKVAAVAILASSAIAVRAQDSKDPWKFPDFSAIELMGPERRPTPAKVYWSGTSLRVDITPALANLYLSAMGKIYKLVVYPDKTQGCIVMRTDQAKMVPHPLEFLQGAKVKRTPVGTETVEGHSCKVENVVVTRADGKTIESKVWEADDLNGVPVKIEAKTELGKFMAVYRDIVLATQDKALFIPPDKCTPYEKMGQVVEKEVIE
jgi:hypothetical protein